MKIIKDEVTVKAFFDGTCGPENPGGQMGIGVYVEHPELGLYWYKGIIGRPNNTINIAEYIAFIAILKHLKDVKHKNIVIKGVSQIVVNQMNKSWGIKEGMYRAYALDAKELLSHLKKTNNVDVLWVPKRLNLAARYLSKKGIASLREKLVK
jgi:ribonuclease HI